MNPRKSAKKLLTRVEIAQKMFKKKPLENLFFATTQKCGSQWIKAVISDRRIKQFTGLATYPQHRHEWTEFHRLVAKVRGSLRLERASINPHLVAIW